MDKTLKVMDNHLIYLPICSLICNWYFKFKYGRRSSK